MSDIAAPTVNHLNSTVVAQTTSATALLLGVNAHVAVEVALQLAKHKIQLLGLESHWYHNPLYRLSLPPTLQVLDHLSQSAIPVENLDYIFIFGDHPHLADCLGLPQAKSAKVFLVLPDSSAAMFYQANLTAAEPNDSLVLQPYPPFAHLTQQVTKLTHLHHQLLQEVQLRDVVQLVDTHTYLSPIQALFCRLPQSQIILAANQSQQTTPISSEDVAKQLLRLCFSRLRVPHAYTLTGNHQQPLINIAFNLQNLARTNLNQYYDIIPLPGLIVENPATPSNLITPKRSTNIDQVLLHVLQETLRRHQTVLPAAPTVHESQVISQAQSPILTNQGTPPSQPFSTTIVTEPEPEPELPTTAFETASPTPAFQTEVESDPITPPPAVIKAREIVLEPETKSLPLEPVAPSPSPGLFSPQPSAARTITKQPEVPKTRWSAPTNSSNASVKRPRFTTAAKSKPAKSSSKWRFLGIGLILLIVMLVLIFFAPFVFSYQAYQKSQNLNLSQVSSAQLQGLINQTQQYSSMTTNNLSLLQQTPLSLHSSLQSLGLKFKLLSLQTQINYQTALAKASGLEALQIILGKQAGDPYPPLKDTQDRLFLLYGLLTKQLEQVNTLSPVITTLSTQDQSLVKMLEEKLPATRQKVLEIQQAVSLYPHLVKPNQKADILVLLQNHLELRPTGGFVDSVAILNFDSGKLLGIDSHSVYDLDSQLKGQVDPPADLAKLLGETNWFLRDVNWDPDFPNTSRNAEWFLDKELNQPVIATLGETSLSLQLLLAALGEQTTSSNQLVSNQNLISLLRNEAAPELKSQTKQLPLLNQTYQSLIESFKTAEPEAQLAFLDAWYTSFSTNQARLTAHDEAAMSGLVELSWAGQLIEPVCPTDLSQQACVVDYFALNEANVGVNKANSHLIRRQEHTVNLATDAISHSHLLTLTNTAESNNWPVGDYQTYLRAYLPANSELKRVLVNNQALDTEAITLSVQHGKNIVGFSVLVPIKQSSAIEISYTTPYKLEANQQSTYALLIQKQPGIEPNQLQLTVKTPAGYIPQQATHPYQVDQAGLHTELQTDQDLFFAVELQP